MKNKQKALVLVVLFITAIFIVNSYVDPGTAKMIVGFAGVPTSEFSGAKELGAATVQVNTLSASELEFALETAKSLGLGLVGRAEIVDIATFVITPKKLRLSPDYIANEATTAKMVSGPGDYDFSILQPVQFLWLRTVWHVHGRVSQCAWYPGCTTSMGLHSRSSICR